MGDLIEIMGTTWEVVDIVPAKADSAVVAIIAWQPLITTSHQARAPSRRRAERVCAFG